MVYYYIILIYNVWMLFFCFRDDSDTETIDGEGRY